MFRLRFSEVQERNRLPIIASFSYVFACNRSWIDATRIRKRTKALAFATTEPELHDLSWQTLLQYNVTKRFIGLYII